MLPGKKPQATARGSSCWQTHVTALIISGDLRAGMFSGPVSTLVEEIIPQVSEPPGNPAGFHGSRQSSSFALKSRPADFQRPVTGWSSPSKIRPLPGRRSGPRRWPHHQRLAAMHVARGEELRHARLYPPGGVPRLVRGVERRAERLGHVGLAAQEKPRGDEHQVAGNLALAARTSIKRPFSSRGQLHRDHRADRAPVVFRISLMVVW